MDADPRPPQGHAYQPSRDDRDAGSRQTRGDLAEQLIAHAITQAVLGADPARDHPDFQGQRAGSAPTGLGVLPTNYAATAIPAAARHPVTSASI